MEFTHVGVVGAGVMGAGVAQNLGETGHQVVLVDIDPQQLEKARETVRTSVRMNVLFKRKPGGDSPDVVVNRICFTTDYEQLAVSQFLIENVVEKPQVKQEVYGKIDSICDPACIFAANTSAISITR